MSLCDTLSLESFTVYCLQSEHSYLPSDSDFGIIDKAKKSGKEMYIPHQRMELVHHCHKQKPFTVAEMQYCDFVDLLLTAEQLADQKKASDGFTVKWLNIQQSPRRSFAAYEVHVWMKWIEVS